MLKLCLFSPVKGVVVKNGQPVSGAVIERTCKWNWKKYKPQQDETVTNDKGEFSMPGIYSLLSVVQLVPHEPVIHQQILIKHEGETYEAWYLVKHEYGEFAELDMAEAVGALQGLHGQPINISCELTAEAKNHGGAMGHSGIGELMRE